ncbi:transcriptional regulator ovo-like [Pomacea canaliculata]|uniref:transcriptional regulator ovo-like n=1 Tax=Pomacea canaliculata TaxID=400727 RepID=UPI000D72A387|nr:transcriptional regulator ovo-like [Pomacea canaliculata]
MPVQYNWPAYKPPHDLLTLTTDPPFVTPNLQGYQTQFSPAALPSSHPMANSCFLPARPSQIQFTSEHQGHVIASSGTSSPCSPPQTPVDNHQQRRVSSVAPTVDPEDAAVRTSRHTVLLEGKGHADGEKSEGHDEDGEEKEAKGQDITMKIENDKTTQNSSLLKPDEALDHLSHVISTYAPNVNLCPSLVKTVSSVKDGFVGVINSGLGIVNPNYTRSFIPPSDMPGSFQCSVCNKVMKSKRMYNRHRRNHLPVKHFLCVFCYKGFNDSFDLKRHTRTHTGNKPYACPITPCTKTCAQRVTLENHLEKIHGIKTPYEKKERRPKVYVCELCQTTYHTRHEVVEHTKTNHPNDPCLQRLHDRRHFGAEEGSGSSQNQPKARRRTGRQRK